MVTGRFCNLAVIGCVSDVVRGIKPPSMAIWPLTLAQDNSNLRALRGGVRLKRAPHVLPRQCRNNGISYAWRVQLADVFSGCY